MQRAKLFCFTEIVLSVVLGIVQPSHAQLPANPSNDRALIIPVARQITFPPVTTKMPLDVRIGYSYADSLLKCIDVNAADSIADRTTLSDTLMRVAKYCYEMDDYDPVKFFVWQWSSPSKVWRAPGNYNFLGQGLKWRLEELLRKLVPDSSRTMALVVSDYIAEVVVKDTEAHVDSHSRIAKVFYKVTASALDTIKGRRFMPCVSDLGYRSNPKAPDPAAFPDGCLQFEYSPNWLRYGVGPGFEAKMQHEDGTPWVVPGGHYIVFLTTESLGGDSVYKYANVRSIHSGTMGGVYPIVRDIVQNPNGDFGLPAAATVAEFKSRLREFIRALLHS